MRRPERWIRFYMLLLVASSFGCGGGNSASPTGPTATVSSPVAPTQPTANQWQVVLLLSMAAEPLFNNNILGADFLLNGTLEQRRIYAGQPSSAADLTLLKLLSSGRYTVTARITKTEHTERVSGAASYRFEALICGRIAAGLLPR